MKSYRVLMHSDSFKKTETYHSEIISSDGNIAGGYLKKRLKDINLHQMTIEQFIEIIVSTKRPKIFAESEVYGDGSDWNMTELSILGDIGIAVDVTVYDNGQHNNPQVYDEPFSATLLYIPGALLRNGTGNIPADWNEVTVNDRIDAAGYTGLYERRLLPLLLYANKTAMLNHEKAFVTIPGLGCGQFAGPFTGQMGEHLKHALMSILEKYGKEFNCIMGVYFDPYNECNNYRTGINNISFFVRPFTNGNNNKPQLCRPREYQDSYDDFSNCRLFSIVAWDHVSWPGNDFYGGSRATDDGVKAAATSSMKSITGVSGNYTREIYEYSPPEGFHNWEDVVVKEKLKIEVEGNLDVCWNISEHNCD